MTPDQQPGPPTNPDSVRLALAQEAVVIADIQRRGWAETLAPELAEHLLSGLDRDEMAASWRQAVQRPPEARFRVLVAVREGAAPASGEGESPVAGFATTIPCPDSDADPSIDATVDEFVIDPPARRRGHGSRLLNACVDTLRADGFTRATTWVSTDDDIRRQFFAAAGWAPDGSHREIGDDRVSIKQIRMHTDIS